MSENSSSPRSLRSTIAAAIVFPAWVFLGFIAAQLLIGFILGWLNQAGVDFSTANGAVLQTSLGAVIYGLTILLVIGLPWLVIKHRTSLKEIGLHRLPEWKDLLTAPIAFVIYLLFTGLLLVATQYLLPSIDLDQAQEVGFDQLTQRFEFIMAFLMLVVIAPIAEEVLFRGYLFGKLRRHIPLWLAILITSALFGLVHGQLNVGIDTFALSIVMCLAVVFTGSLWPSILIHMLKNGVAFYFLFINPII